MLVKRRKQWRETRGTDEVGEWKSQEARADGPQEESRPKPAARVFGHSFGATFWLMRASRPPIDPQVRVDPTVWADRLYF